VAATVGEQAREKVTTKRDLEAVNRLLAQFGGRGAPS
jgi:2-C-methyl-D-erythritol 4-phosphate cytidylyltransferase